MIQIFFRRILSEWQEIQKTIRAKMQAIMHLLMHRMAATVGKTVPETAHRTSHRTNPRTLSETRVKIRLIANSGSEKGFPVTIIYGKNILIIERTGHESDLFFLYKRLKQKRDLQRGCFIYIYKEDIVFFWKEE